jgi:hypothetical protein
MTGTLKEIGARHKTDKAESPGYLAHYEKYFSEFKEKPVRMLELGVLHGGSLLMWHDYFEQGLIVGLDLNNCPLDSLPDRVRFVKGSQDDVALLTRTANEFAPDGFDIVIDDASHFGSLSRASFDVLFRNHVRPGGMYVVEDWGTGYWPGWPDGAPFAPAESDGRSTTKTVRPSILSRIGSRIPGLQKAVPPGYSAAFGINNSGMVGFVKELIDEVAWPDITHAKRGNPELEQRPSMISSMSVYCGQVFLTRA